MIIFLQSLVAPVLRINVDYCYFSDDVGSQDHMMRSTTSVSPKYFLQRKRWCVTPSR